MSDAEPRVFFGRESVSATEKTRRVQGVFDSVAARYDVMNDYMSLGSHRLLKRVLVESCALRRGSRVLDVAGGTADIAMLIRKAIGSTGSVTCLDINQAMLNEGRNRAIDSGCMEIRFVQADAQRLPFKADQFDALTIGFGLRNVADQPKALAEFRRVLRPGQRLAILEFAKPANTLLRTAFHAFKMSWPVMGQLVVGTPGPYQYLVDSIETHPSQDVLALMMKDSGFKGVRYDNLLGGIVALHLGSA